MRIFSAVVVVLGWVWCLVVIGSVLLPSTSKHVVDAAAKEYGLCMQSVWQMERTSNDRGKPLSAMDRSFLEWGCKNPQGTVDEWRKDLAARVVDAFIAFDEGLALLNKNQKDLQAAGVIPNAIPDDPISRKVGRL